MSQTITVWCAIAGLLLCAFLIRAIEWYFIESNHKRRNKSHLLEIGKEREMLYIPGDTTEDDFDD